MRIADHRHTVARGFRDVLANGLRFEGGPLRAIISYMSRRSAFPILIAQLGALVAGIAACGPDTSCSDTATAPTKMVELSADRACAFAKQSPRGDLLSNANCADVCGSPYNQCRFDADYEADFGSRNPDGGPAPVADGGIVTTQTCPTRTAKITCSHDLGCIGGRATEGMLPIGVSEPTLLAHLAASAHLEAVSVVAFERLASELARFEAPVGLVDAARDAAKDERRHVALLEKVMENEGGSLEASSLSTTVHPSRSLFQVAVENAREGCVRETYGALVCAFAGNRAEGAELRAAMRIIAEDEGRHAAFSWDLHEWALAKLEPHEADVVRAELRSARIELAETVQSALDAPKGLGWPSRPESARLIAEMERHFPEA